MQIIYTQQDTYCSISSFYFFPQQCVCLVSFSEQQCIWVLVFLMVSQNSVGRMIHNSLSHCIEKNLHVFASILSFFFFLPLKQISLCNYLHEILILSTGDRFLGQTCGVKNVGAFLFDIYGNSPLKRGPQFIRLNDV